MGGSHTLKSCRGKPLPVHAAGVTIFRGCRPFDPGGLVLFIKTGFHVSLVILGDIDMPDGRSSNRSPHTGVQFEPVVSVGDVLIDMIFQGQLFEKSQFIAIDDDIIDFRCLLE